MTGGSAIEKGPRGNRLRPFVWGAAACLLLLPAVAMQWFPASEVNWTALDFIAMGVLLAILCGLYELGAWMSDNIAYRAGFGLAGFRFDPPIHGYLRDRERLAGAPDWEVLATPGHTDCSTCLWNAKTRTLLTGDTVLSIHGRAWFNPEYVDAEASARTEAMLRRLPVEHLLPGHGHPVSGPRVMAEALSHRERPRGWSPLTCRARPPKPAR